MAKAMKMTKPKRKGTSMSPVKKRTEKRVRLWFLDDELKENELHKYVDGKIFTKNEAKVIDPTHDGPQVAEFFAHGFLNADAVLLDHEFGTQQTQWAPPDGAGYVSHLRSLARRDTTHSKPPPVVILTGQEEAFSREVPAVGPEFPLSGSFCGREAFIAPVLDVEWILSKRDVDVRAKISSIAQTYAETKILDASSGVSLSDLCKLMDLPKSDWRDGAKDSLLRARPPISENAIDSARGPTGVVRWLLHDALRFPGVLLSDLQVACALGISGKALRLLPTSSRSALSVAMKSAIYSGALRDVVDRRWWSAAIDDLKWRMPKELASQLDARPSPGDQVVHVNVELAEIGIASITDCLPIQPRAWPPDAMQPFMKIDDLKTDHKARTMVDPNDLPKLLDATK